MCMYHMCIYISTDRHLIFTHMYMNMLPICIYIDLDIGTCPVRESKMVGIKNDEPAEKICCTIHSGSCSEL